MPPLLSGFDKLARPYRWLEYLSFGPLLMRTRLAFLPEVLSAKRALLLGDGDGRFCAALLSVNPLVRVDAVDGSHAMLQALHRRAVAVTAEARLATHLQNVLDPLPCGPYDVVCTHFLLDCLTEQEVTALAVQIRNSMVGGAWIVSEFAVPAGTAHWPARLLVGLLYRAFGLLTGLKIRHLPRHGDALRAAGFCCSSVQTRLFGMLRSELWHSPDVFNRPSKLELR